MRSRVSIQTMIEVTKENMNYVYWQTLSAIAVTNIMEIDITCFGLVELRVYDTQIEITLFPVDSE